MWFELFLYFVNVECFRKFFVVVIGKDFFVKEEECKEVKFVNGSNEGL